MNQYPTRLFAGVLLSLCLPLNAAPLDAALEESRQLAAEAKASQARIEQLDDATRQMLTEYRNAVQQAEALKAYNEQLVEIMNKKIQKCITCIEESAALIHHDLKTF